MAGRLVCAQFQTMTEIVHKKAVHGIFFKYW